MICLTGPNVAWAEGHQVISVAGITQSCYVHIGALDFNYVYTIGSKRYQQSFNYEDSDCTYGFCSSIRDAGFATYSFVCIGLVCSSIYMMVSIHPSIVKRRACFKVTNLAFAALSAIAFFFSWFTFAVGAFPKFKKDTFAEVCGPHFDEIQLLPGVAFAFAMVATSFVLLPNVIERAYMRCCPSKIGNRQLQDLDQYGEVVDGHAMVVSTGKKRRGRAHA